MHDLALPGRKGLLLCFVAILSFALFVNISFLSTTDVSSRIKDISVGFPSFGKIIEYANPHSSAVKPEAWQPEDTHFENHESINDYHPIFALMRKADEAWRQYDEDRSQTFKQAIEKYRITYGRNPPPGFKEWYLFSRERGVHNLDDFGQIMDDLRPFWAIEPAMIRSFAAHLHEDEANGISGLHIRNGKVWKLTNANWRVETFAGMVKAFANFLPDMDIAMNRLDQPRVVVPWEEMQSLLAKEVQSRQILANSSYTSTPYQKGLYDPSSTTSEMPDPKFFSASGHQYMNLARDACPPESHARDSLSSPISVEARYKDVRGGFVTNFNLTSDLCTVGPEMQEKHGFLFAPSTIVASRSPLPIFGECKVNVNSDILFPANMYYKNDDRYAYSPTHDLDWDDKKDDMVWRGVTSGGTNTAENWKNMHRQRLVLFTNDTIMTSREVRIMTQHIDRSDRDNWENFYTFLPGNFAKQHTDVGFTSSLACSPDCQFYDDVWTYKNMTTLSQQFESKYVVDVDGHSFSGRWHAFLQSKSLGIKSTIFREWHDSRLFAWRHFVPMDNRYDDLYSILTYFIGLGTQFAAEKGDPYVPRHDIEAMKIARQGREWAEKVLRREDMEIYTFRLLLEYGRIIDENRNEMGYSGDGSELDQYDTKNPMS